MSKPSPEILQTYIADVLFGNGSLTPEDSVNNVTQERMFAAGAIVILPKQYIVSWAIW
jgi:hypothetical protein